MSSEQLTSGDTATATKDGERRTHADRRKRNIPVAVERRSGRQTTSWLAFCARVPARRVTTSP